MNTTKRDLTISGLSFVCILFLIFVTNPASLPAVFLLVMPILSGLLAWGVVRVIMGTFFDLTSRHTHITSFMCGVGTTVILALGSIHQLGLQDVILTALLLGGLLFYSLRVNVQEN